MRAMSPLLAAAATLGAVPKPKPQTPARRMSQIATLEAAVKNGYAVEQGIDGGLSLRHRDEDEKPQSVHAMSREKARRLKQAQKRAAKNSST